MKKYILIFVLFISCIVMSGCKHENEVNNTPLLGGWQNIFNKQNNVLSEEEKYIFDKAKERYTDLELEAVSILGKQVVAGTNYMYLAKATNKNGVESYKIVVLYYDLEGYSSITKVTDFDYAKYVNKDLESNNEMLSGGWYSESLDGVKLDEKIQNVFSKATNTLTGMTYNPIAVLGTQVVSGNNYAILCFGSPSVKQSDSVTNVYLLTIYEDLDGNSEIKSICYINLSDYN